MLLFLVPVFDKGLMTANRDAAVAIVMVVVLVGKVGAMGVVVTAEETAGRAAESEGSAVAT